LYKQYIRNEQATNIIIDLVVVNIGVDRCFYSEIIGKKFIIKNFTVVRRFNCCRIITKKAVLNRSVIGVVER